MRRPLLPDSSAGVRRRAERVLADIFVSAAPDDPRDVLRPALEVDADLMSQVRERMPAGLSGADAAHLAFDLLWPAMDIEPGRPALWHVLQRLSVHAPAVAREEIAALHEPLKSVSAPNPLEFDLFFSYARKDNELSMGASALPWVTRLTRDLQAVVRGFTLPFLTVTGSDHRLADAQGIDEYQSEMLPLLAASRVGVIVLSPESARSEVCQWELRQLYSAKTPLVIVEHRSLEPDTPIPTEIMAAERSTTIPFYRPVSEHGASGYQTLHPDATDYEIDISDSYYNRVRDLATALIAVLAGHAGGSGPWVYLAETDDLIQEREDLRTRLRRDNLRVAPTRRYTRGSPQEYRDAVLEDLGQCGVFAQLLGEHPGGYPGGTQPGVCFLQYQVARRKNIPMVLCLAENVSANRSYQQWGDHDHRTLLGQDKDAVETRSFVDAIKAQVRRLDAANALAAPPEVSPPSNVSGTPEAFLAFERTDSALADQAEQVLRIAGFAVTRRGMDHPGFISEGDGFSVRQRDAMAHCDAVFLLFGPGADAVDWVTRYAPQCLKYVNKREKPLLQSACVLCSFGPLDRPRPDLGMVEDLRYEAFPAPFDRFAFLELVSNVRKDINSYALMGTSGQASTPGQKESTND